MIKIWAVEPNFLVGYLETILNIGEELKDKPAAFFDSVLSSSEEIFSVSGENAVINIKGILTQEGPSFLDRLFGFDGTSYGDILQAIAAIQKAEEVKTVRLVMNTPGGQVDGVDKVFQAIQALGKTKTVIAESHGLIASAGYWIASAASKIVATSPVDEIGSIGVVVVSVDFSKSREDRGVKVVVIRSENAPDKIPDISTEKGKNIIQERVNATERVFIARISEGRVIEMETVKKTFARGSVLIAKDPDSNKPDALSVGMIDSVESPVSPVMKIKGDHKKKSLDNPPIMANKKEEVKPMNLQEAMKDDELRIAIENRDGVNFAKGQHKEREEAKSRIEKCKKYIVSDEYPKVVKDLALKVISGESDYSALEGAVTVIDAQKEEAKAKAAIEETDGHEDTPPDNHDGGTAPEGVCETNEDFTALEKEIREGN
jgi:ClpP class serine protease